MEHRAYRRQRAGDANTRGIPCVWNMAQRSHSIMLELNGGPEALGVLRDRREEQCRRRDERLGQLRLF